MSFVHAPRCAQCEQPAGRLEILAYGERPAGFDEWPEIWKELFFLTAKKGESRLLVASVFHSNEPTGESISHETAKEIEVMVAAFGTAAVTTRFPDKFGHCEQCAADYCANCWGGDPYGECPHGHHSAVDPGATLTSPPTPDSLPDPEVVRETRMAWARLDRRMGVVLDKIIAQGMSRQTIAAYLGISEEDVKNRLNMAPDTSGLPDDLDLPDGGEQQ